jgi:hypothetical protein
MGCNCKESNTKCNCQCPPGEKGDNGKNWVYSTSYEAPGSNCVYGGYLLQGGPDTNGDGVPDQILSQYYVCNGAPSNQYVVKTTAEAPGSNCAYGGYKIDVGIDADNDGVPDSQIITSYICNGGDGTGAEPPTFTAGTMTVVAYGDPLTMNIREITPNVYAIDLEVPSGPPGASASTDVTMTGIIADCLDFTGATNLSDYLNIIIAKICSMTSLTGQPYAFQGVLDRELAGEISLNMIDSGGVGYYYIPFPDDTNSGYDNGNNFYTDSFICPVAAPDMALIVENLQFQGVGGGAAGAAGLSVQIVKRGVTYAGDTVINSIAVTAQEGAVTASTVLNSLTTGISTLVAGSAYSVRIISTNAGGRTFLMGSGKILANAKFSNNF